MTSPARPAFYALAPGGWRDYVTLLHPPYTLWHLSYVAIGAALAPRVDWGVLGLAVLAFALALGVGAHALDELNGRPLRTEIPDGVLIALAVISIAGAAAIGLVVAMDRSLWLLAFVAFGAFVVVAYNLELAGGRFHTDLWFGLAWGAFPLLTGAFAMDSRLTRAPLVAAVFALCTSLAQRQLSTQVRTVRRRTTAITGTIELRDGSSEPLDATWLAGACERALQVLVVAMVALAGALLLLRVP
ncbi:MAG TPA: hypothetical protein VGF23_03655 [Gaiellaceae bacterium]